MCHVLKSGKVFQPLKRLQNKTVDESSSSDLIGRTVTTTGTVTKSSGSLEWSGTTWKARLANDVEQDELPENTQAEIVDVKSLALILKPVS